MSKLKDELEKKYNMGSIVVLNHMEGEPQMPIGLKGVITHIDDIGQIHVRWENGSSLALDPSLDSFSVICKKE